MGFLAVDFLRDGLVDGDGQNHLFVILAHLHLVFQPRHLLELGRLQFLVGDFVDGECNLLVFVVLVEVAVVEVGFLFVGNHLPHQFHSRVVLAAVSLFLGTHGNLLEHLGVGLELDVEFRGGTGINGYHLRLIAYRTEGELPSVVSGDGIMAVDFRHHGHSVSFVDGTGKGDAVTIGGIDDVARNLGMERKRKEKKEKKQKPHPSTPRMQGEESFTQTG